VTNLELLDGVFSYLFTATNVSSREELAALNPALVRLHWDGALLLTPPFRKSITGTVRRNAEDWSSYTLDFGELGRLNNAGALTVRIPMDFFAYFTATTADALTLRAWAQTFEAAAQAQMRTNIGAASASDLAAHTSDTDIHVTDQEKDAWDAKYDKPAGGIPDTDLADKYAGAAVAGGAAVRTASIPFGKVDGTSTSTVYTATVPGVTELRDGVAVYLMNGVVTSASGFTLNINGLGAKPVYQTMAAATRVTTLFNVNYTMLFIYNEDRVTDGCWDMFYGYNSDTNTIAYNIRTNATAGNANSAIYRYELLFSLPDGTLEPANNVSNKPTTYTKALSTESFMAFEPIYYYATTSSVAAGAAPGASYLYTQYSSVDLRYSFNAGTTLTLNKPVYIRCTPQADCQLKLDGNDCLVQTLPTTADGKVYLYLGKAYSNYQIWMSQNHPIYEYTNGKLQLWTG
jgi:hypothetical protein